MNSLLLKPGFHISGKSQTTVDFAVFRTSQTFPTNEYHKSKTSMTQTSGINRKKRRMKDVQSKTSVAGNRD